MPDTTLPTLSVGPVRQTARILSLDVLRGFAVLGILVMNIQSFSMIGVAYINPTAYGDLTGANYVVWLLCHVLADMKFLSIFSMLFGAGIVLMTSRREAATGRSAGVHYRRMGWLLVIGAMHAYLLWYGDVLFSYAMCGFLVFLFRRRKPVTLIILGLAVVGVATCISLLFHFSLPQWPDEAIVELQTVWQPTEETVAKEVATYRGGWLGQFRDRAPNALFFETFFFLMLTLWRAGGLMLVGMGLFKLGFFSAAQSVRAYMTTVVVGFIGGLALILYGVQRNTTLEWAFERVFFLGAQFNYWGSLFFCLAWAALIMLIVKLDLLSGVTRRLATVGQMALTNYITQTLICTTIFYGHGLGLYGKVERLWQLAIVVAVWILQLIWSPLWLRRYRFGPMEWLWRSLTYWKRQPMVRAINSKVL